MDDPRSGSPENAENYPKSEIVGYFSIGEDRIFTPGSSKLKYFYPPSHNNYDFDLDEGRDRFSAEELHNEILKDVSTVKHAPLMLKWIASNQDQIKAPPESDRLLLPHFVCTHGMLVRLLNAPYQHVKGSWRIWAGKWEGTIYLKRISRSYESSRPQYDTNPMNSKFCFWGYKFQQYVSSEVPNQAPDMTKPTELMEEFRCVYQYSLPKFSVLFSSAKKAAVSKEVLTDPIPLDKLEFVDIRTKIIPRVKPENYEEFMKKNQYLKWWTGAHLTNDNKVLCAYTDNEGIVKQLKTFSRDELVEKSMDYWNPRVCIQSCEDLLSLIMEKVLHDCDQTVYVFTKIPGEEVIVTEECPTTENCVVPNWYKQAMSQ